jgi:hypothetical protein
VPGEFVGRPTFAACTVATDNVTGDVAVALVSSVVMFWLT